MSKRILLIDSDEAFAQGLSNAITARGFTATMATNSEQGMSLAKQENPDLIVVCVEAQPTNGYMLCTRLKKDDALKGIPVILTSANATPDSFEKHKKLKTRAEEYLIKPFEPNVMLEKASALMGIALPAEQIGEDEIVAVDDEPLGLGDLVDGEDEPISLSESDARAAQSGQAEEVLLVEEVEEVEVEEEKAAGDDDLDMFDKAFDSLGAPAVTAQAEGTQRFAEALAEPVGAPVITPPPPPTEISAPPDDAVLDTLQESPGTDLEARVAELEQKLAEREAELEQARKGEGSSASLLKLKEAKNKADKELLRLKEELNGKDKELVELQEAQTALEGQAQQLKDDAVKREAAAKTLQQRADALAAAAKKFERELTAAREEAKKGAKSADLEKELEKLKERTGELETELNELKGEKELLVEERDELKKQLEDAQVTAVANEDRAVKAYQKIKGDEKLREKTRKALEIALQLLQENADGEETDGAAKKSA
ncbi:MAG: response regulator [Myxococcales bacterium]|nr:response regulator [Myxococcales bacterium]